MANLVSPVLGNVWFDINKKINWKTIFNKFISNINLILSNITSKVLEKCRMVPHPCGINKCQALMTVAFRRKSLVSLLLRIVCNAQWVWWAENGTTMGDNGRILNTTQTISSASGRFMGRVHGKANMVQFIHGSIQTWFYSNMVVFLHGSIHTWFYSNMVLFIHGSIQTWYFPKNRAYDWHDACRCSSRGDSDLLRILEGILHPTHH